MAGRTLRISSAGGTVDLPTDSINPDGLSLINGIAGLGLPDVQVRMGSGAGDGASIQGSRVLERASLSMQIRVSAPNEAGLMAHLSTLWKILGNREQSARLTWGVAGQSWRLDVTRTGGGQHRLGIRTMTDAETYINLTPITLVAPDPYWTATTAATRVLEPQAVARGLLTGEGSLSGLHVSSSEVLGDVTFTNTGDTDAYPTVLIQGPATAYTAISPDGETLSWAGVLTAGESITFDHKAKTARDHTGANRYGELDTAPRFWSIPPGETVATFGLEGTSADSRITVSWLPRRAAVI